MKAFMDYDRPSITADVVLLRVQSHFVDARKGDEKQLQIRLIKRNAEPYKNYWGLPGGFVDIDKTIADVANSKTFEKAGYKDFYMEQLYTFDQPNRDNRWRVISTAYIGIVKPNSEPFNDCCTCDSKWFNIKEDSLISEDGAFSISFNELAFDHKKIIQMALERIRNKIFYSDIGFEFVPKLFTVRDLHKTFESLLGRPVLNFQRTMQDRIEKTEHIYSEKASRPAALYKKKEVTERI